MALFNRKSQLLDPSNRNNIFSTYLDESINFDTSLEVKSTSSFEAALKLGFLLLEVEGEKLTRTEQALVL